MLPANLFLFSAILIAGNFNFVVADAESSAVTEAGSTDCAHDCPEDEVYSECGNNACQNTCANPNIAPVCKAICNAGCICAEGLLRNTKGVCVNPKDCDTCKANEVFSPCGNHGCLSTCAQPDLLERCDYVPGCYPGCICNEGFLRDPSGNCIPKENCACGEYEVYSDSGKWICENSCAQPKKSTFCKAAAYPGCGCREGYLRVKEGVCVLPEDCDNGCEGDPNAYFDKCGDPCPVTCNNMAKGGLTCESCLLGGGCKCKKGFVKDIHGKCIKPCDCPKCGDNEVFACGSACDTTCATLGDVCPIINIKCNDKCYCVDGYARDKNNKCVPIKQCPPKFTCPKTQVYNACPASCPVQGGCGTYLLGIVSDPVCIPSDTRVCKPKCECKTGLLLKSEKECVKPEQCCQDPNAEVVSCPNPCPGGTCESPKFADCKAPCRIRGCQCKSGYVKDAEGKCIKLSNCPNTKCPANEVYNACPGYCTFDMDCPTLLLGLIRDCAAPPEDFPCSPRCECKEGFVRIGSDCVLPDKCCEDPNSEVVSCPNPCPGGTCDQPEFTPCRVACREKGCQCKKGFVKDSNGKCITLDKCPPKCNANEVWKECGTKCPPTCANKTPFCTKDCATGCFCVDGYIRQNGKCIPIDDCPKCGANEVFACGSACDSTCATLGDICPIINKKCTDKCYCVEGYARDKNNVCIPIKQCPPKCGANEVFACGSACDTTCATLGQICPIVNIKCNDMCYCIDGYARDNNNVCIPVKQCPPKCPNPNQQYYTGCMPCVGSCSNKNPICSHLCRPGCACNPGYLKKSDSDDTCILESECPAKSCPGPNEEYTECGTCEKTCENKDLSLACIAVCQVGCFCKAGYVRNNGICSLPEECPPKCTKANQVYKSCGTRCPPTCDNRFPICTKECFPGCACKDGYILNNGNCILVANCPKTPPPKKCDLNEEYVACPPACPAEPSCTSLLAFGQPECSSVTGPKCNPACRCKAGYVRDSKKKCVLPGKCCTDCNSELVDNPNCCPGGTCASPKFIPCKRACPSKGCQCKKGFLKKNDTDQTCVAVSECCKYATKK
nr:zonadhesin-like protein 1A [Limnephilus flavicornis]